MPQKRLDLTTLRNIARKIWDRPGNTLDFFGRAGLKKPEIFLTSEGTYNFLRKWNEEDAGELVPKEIEKVLLRLASPLEYSNDLVAVKDSTKVLNHWLQAEE